MIKFLTPVLLALLLSSCSIVQTPVIGLLYTNVKSSKNASSNLVAKKVGMACSHSILGLFAWGDSTIYKASRIAKIQKISSVDTKSTNFIGIYGKYCTIVHGS